MTAYDLCFFVLGTLCLASATIAVTTKHVTHAALWLIVALATLSGCYLVLGAELVALANLLVYIGAVVVLVLVAMMLTRAPVGRSLDQDAPLVRRAGAFVVACAAAALLGTTLVFSWGTSTVQLGKLSARELAVQIFGQWVWAFEVLSLLLLVAAVAAFALLRVRVPVHERRRQDSVP